MNLRLNKESELNLERNLKPEMNLEHLILTIIEISVTSYHDPTFSIVVNLKFGEKILFLKFLVYHRKLTE